MLALRGQFCVYLHSADRGSAPLAPGISPALFPALSPVVPGWPAALQSVYADGSYPAGSRCTPAAGCLDYVEPGEKMIKKAENDM